MDALYELVMTVALIVCGIALFFCLFRAIKGPSTADRLIAVNMTGTVVVAMILILTVMLEEGLSLFEILNLLKTKDFDGYVVDVSGIVSLSKGVKKKLEFKDIAIESLLDKGSLRESFKI